MGRCGRAALAGGRPPFLQAGQFDLREQRALAFAQKADETLAKHRAHERFRLRKSFRKLPIWLPQRAGADRDTASKRASLLFVDIARSQPWHQRAALNPFAPGGPGIAPRTDCPSPQRPEMRAAAECTAQIARQRTHVVAAAHDEAKLAGARQVVSDPARLVQVNADAG